MAGLLRELFGAEVASSLHAPYSLGEPETLTALLEEAGLRGTTIRRRDGTARFPSIASRVHTDIKGWTLAERIDDARLARLQVAARESLRRFLTAQGMVTFAHPAHIATAERP